MRAWPTVSALFVLTACASKGVEGARAPGSLPKSAGATSTAHTVAPRVHAKHAPEAVSRPKQSMNLAEAQQYMLRLVNRDRDAEGLPAVTWDEHAAGAGQRHAEDMVLHGYTAHYGTDGSVPEQRHTAAGGVAMVQENAGCVFDGAERKLEPHPLFLAEEIEKVETAFMNEAPPHDGHRRNILTGWHNHVGIGLAKPAGVPLACVAQEFTDIYGSYASLPASARVGDKLSISGEIHGPATFGGVGLARIDIPSPKTPAELNELHSYPVPQPYATYFPKGFVTPLAVDVQGGHFKIEVPLGDAGKPGLYEVSVWAHVPETPELVMVSLRTLPVK